MITVSLCMIVKNEEDVLERCLNSVHGAVDEIIIADTGSADRTKEIAARFTDKLYDFVWEDDFSAARNFSYSHATMDYIMWLDADDIILPEDRNKLIILKETLPADTKTVMMKYNTGFDNQGKATFSCYRERLSRRDAGFRWKEAVHEYLDVTGDRVMNDICVTHAKPHNRSSDGRNLAIYEKSIAKGVELSPRGMYYYARELKDNGRYSQAAEYFRKFLNSGLGWVEDNISACGDLAVCFLEMSKPEEALLSLFRSFDYDTPRAEICCMLGYFYKKRANYKQAAFWFGLVFTLKNTPTTGFCQTDYRGFIPCIELAVCYDKMGDYLKAAKLNEMAGMFKSNSPEVLYNREYFQKRLVAEQL